MDDRLILVAVRRDDAHQLVETLAERPLNEPWSARLYPALLEALNVTVPPAVEWARGKAEAWG